MSYDQGDTVTIDGVKYEILYFYKKAQGRPLIAKLRGENGKQLDILKRDLMEDKPLVKEDVPSKKETLDENIPLKKENLVILEEAYKDIPTENYLDAKPSDATFKRKSKKKK